MSTTPSEPPARVALAVLLLLAGLLLPACSVLGDDEPEPPGDAASTAPPPADVVGSLSRALDRRAEAVRTGDRRAFTAGLARRAPLLRRQQQVYFDNLRQLPLARFAYSFRPGDVVRDGDAYRVVVRLEMQLAGYDAEPVVSQDRFRFRAAPGGRRMLLASVTDEAWEAANDVQPQPWDLGPVEVRGGYGVLGVFDPDSVAHAPGLVASVERGLADVSAVVPYDWRRSVVVYALSSTAFLETIDELPGGDPSRLDGVAFPVMAGPGVRRTAATRFALHPRMLTRAGPQRDRLVRHELVHVALGDRDDRAPVWLSEGIAEYVSVRPIAPEDRLVAQAALDRALAGVDALPTAESFTDDAGGPVVSYGLSWWVCEYLADSFGPDALWTLLDAMGAPDAEPDRVLRDLLGLTPRQLARRAARKLVLTFAPERASSSAGVPQPVG